MQLHEHTQPQIVFYRNLNCQMLTITATAHAEMTPGFCKLNLMTQYRKCKGSIHMVCLTNPISQPSFEISPTLLLFVIKKVGNLSTEKATTISNDLPVYIIFIWRFHSSPINNTDHKQVL
jgi:hypothetical protein